MVWQFLQALLLLLFSTAWAQNCYYPNGDQSSTDAPCGSGPGVVCCPLQWQCLSNGLCALPDQNLLGRYTCTDRTWKSSKCPQFCTQNLSATGNEDIQECSDGTFCCNGNGSLDCCSKSTTGFLELGAGRAVATITALSSVASSRSSSASSLSASSTTTSQPTSTSTSSQDRSSSTTSATSSETSTTETISTANNNPPPSPPTHNTPLILGLAIGIPAAFFALLTLLSLIHRHKKATSPKSPTFSDYTKDPSMRYSYGHFPPEGRAPELDSYPVAKQEPNRTSELPYSPAISSLRDSYASPPGYSPEMRQGGGNEPVELWAGYVPYRPGQAGQGQMNVVREEEGVQTSVGKVAGGGQG